ncbi:MAG: undecaprenyl-diphosphate phosphatase [Planctomycetota bacterium]|nr:undecaprenyl-diphosphate phosphatase [Planctomycetota bacterium]
MASPDGAAELGYAKAVLLGLVQGATEFLPISSSGHLALVEMIWGKTEDLAVDIALHIATAAIILGAYGRDLLLYWRVERRVLLYLAVGSLPAAAAGALFYRDFEALRHSPLWVCLGLYVTAGVLTAAERIEAEPILLRRLGLQGALLIGLWQAVAIALGISRSGSTIAVGILLGLERAEAVKFAFLLGVPAILGAGFLSFLQAPARVMAAIDGPLAAGFAAALLTGWLTLHLLTRLVISRRLRWFAIYCAAVATVALGYFTLVSR